MDNFISYGETSGFSPVSAGELELVNGGKGGPVEVDVKPPVLGSGGTVYK